MSGLELCRPCQTDVHSLCSLPYCDCCGNQGSGGVATGTESGSAAASEADESAPPGNSLGSSANCEPDDTGAGAEKQDTAPCARLAAPNPFAINEHTSEVGYTELDAVLGSLASAVGALRGAYAIDKYPVFAETAAELLAAYAIVRAAKQQEWRRLFPRLVDEPVAS